MTARTSLLRSPLLLLCAAALFASCAEKKKPAAPMMPISLPAPSAAAQKDTSDEDEDKPKRRLPSWSGRSIKEARVPPLPPLEGDKSPAMLYKKMRHLAETGDLKQLEKHLTDHASHLLGQMTPKQLTKVFGANPGEVSVNGGRAVLQLSGSPGVKYAVFLAADRRWKYDITLSLKYREWELRPKHPDNQPVSLEEATEGIPGEGTLYVQMLTSAGTVLCMLYEDLAPITVANFVGLARGKRAFRDPVTKEWVKRRFYDGTIFHKAVPDFMIQAGSLTDDGKTGPGYSIPDELDLRLRHSDGGTLSMANSGPNTAGSQFFISERSLDWLDDRHAVFGRCWPVDFVGKLSRGDKRPGSERPIVDVVIKKMSFRRGEPPE